MQPLIHRNVSIPSSRVGTLCPHRAQPRALSFHPLKSGRNSATLKLLKPSQLVSIPSSRVGTLSSTVSTLLELKFPSPQVGSEPDPARRFQTARELFPSPQVGSEPVARQCPNLRCSFPSPQVGSEHCDKWKPSGNDSEFPSPQVGSEHDLRGQLDGTQVSIPSSRVGTKSSHTDPWT